MFVRIVVSILFRFYNDFRRILGRILLASRFYAIIRFAFVSSGRLLKKQLGIPSTS